MSDEDEPAPSPSATVVARRASREAKSWVGLREESGCDEDTSSDEEWDPVQLQEQDEEDEQDERRVRRKHPLYKVQKPLSRPSHQVVHFLTL